MAGAGDHRGGGHVARAPPLPVARAAVERELAAIDRTCSRFRADSELSRVNAAGGRRVVVDPLLVEAVAAALRAARLTGGAVDPTIGGALVLAGYDRDLGDIRPSPDPLKAIRAPGWRTVAVDPATARSAYPRG